MNRLISTVIVACMVLFSVSTIAAAKDPLLGGVSPVAVVSDHDLAKVKGTGYYAGLYGYYGAYYANYATLYGIYGNYSNLNGDNSSAESYFSNASTYAYYAYYYFYYASYYASSGS